MLAETYQQKYGITLYVKEHLGEKGIRVETFFKHNVYSSDESEDSEDGNDYDSLKDTFATINVLNDILSIQKTLPYGQCWRFVKQQSML